MKYRNKLTWSGLLLMAPLAIFGQENGGGGTTYFSNALFNTLLIITIMLLILIIALSGAVKNIVQSDYFVQKINKDKNDNQGAKTLGLLFVFFLSSYTLGAQSTKPPPANEWLIGGLDYFTFYFMLAVILIEAIVATILLSILKEYTRSETKVSETAKAKKVIGEKTLIDKLNDAIEIEKEEEIMLDHNYDGIRELDNNLPPWWKYGFYLTILVAVVYMVSYHVTGTGKLQIAEYNEEMLMAKLKVEEFMRTSANNVDETTVKELIKPEDLNSGKQLFITNCVTCHGKSGEGNGVGPNLTDNYWLHSGGIVDVFKTIKYGWPDKGMKSWKEDFSPVQMAQLASYIRSLKGTNPPNPRAPQGDLYEEQGVKADSTLKVSESATVNVPANDSLIKK